MTSRSAEGRMRSMTGAQERVGVEGESPRPEATGRSAGVVARIRGGGPGRRRAIAAVALGLVLCAGAAPGRAQETPASSARLERLESKVRELEAALAAL